MMNLYQLKNVDVPVDNRCRLLERIGGSGFLLLAVMLLWSISSYSQKNSSAIFVDSRINSTQIDPSAETVRPEQIIVDTISGPTPAPVVEEWARKLYVKTNALGWGLAIANAAVEMDLCRHWSFSLPIYYSAWNYFSTTVKFRTAMIQPEIRYWLRDDNGGWYAGGHIGIGHYNIATNGEYRTQDHEGKSPAWGGGLALGYRMPISRDNRWKMEFSIGAGAYRLHHDKFRNHYNGLLVYSEKKTYFGIDQASVSFAYTFDLKKKGGAR